ncbi:ParB-like partition protein [Mycobacterium phage LilMcDreamy]|uniref:ParB-like nuclease domain protein n=1 Tax=Mycobacterium phage LilMcDreamy TaxID=2652422 RepID=A0A5P8D7F1_9CAUD|nr:ParB-like partition protein [Mycobacterium phage LilMcDreamy]QFP94621.1 ParB-like nuclease domain protein [Mycobacterium phage LilMcDreamy]
MASKITPAVVGKTTTVAPHELNTFHRNPRRGDVTAIAASLKAHSQYKPITVNLGTATGRPNEVLAGNHTLMAIRDLAEKHPDDPRWSGVLVHWLNVDDDMCNRIVAADNQTAQLGGFDTGELLELLNDIGDIEGLGFTEADVADLNAILEESMPDISGMSVNPFDRQTPNGNASGVGDPDEGATGETGGGSDTPEKPKVPRTGPDGLINSKDVNQNKSEYAESATRMVILNYPIAQFIWVQEQLEVLRNEREIANNAELLLALITDATGAEPPAADAPAPGAE